MSVHATTKKLCRLSTSTVLRRMIMNIYQNHLSSTQKEDMMKEHGQSMTFLTINKKSNEVLTVGLISGVHILTWDTNEGLLKLFIRDKVKNEATFLCYINEVNVADVEKYILKRRPNGDMYSELSMRRPFDKNNFSKITKLI